MLIDYKQPETRRHQPESKGCLYVVHEHVDQVMCPLYGVEGCPLFRGSNVQYKDSILMYISIHRVRNSGVSDTYEGFHHFMHAQCVQVYSLVPRHPHQLLSLAVQATKAGRGGLGTRLTGLVAWKAIYNRQSI